MNKAGPFILFSLFSMGLLISPLMASTCLAQAVDSPANSAEASADKATAPSEKTVSEGVPAAPVTANSNAVEKVAAPEALSTFEEAYKTGIQSYQAKDYAKSRDAFAKALTKNPHNSSALTNLALAQFKLNEKGWAIAYFRKSLELEPDQPTAVAGLNFALSQLAIKEIPHQIETYETIRSQFLQPVTLNVYLLLTAIFLFATGWTILAYVGKRRQALRSEERLPSFPVISLLLSAGLVVLFTLTALKFYDASLTRATIVADKVSVQTAPGANQVVLFELHAGFEVLVRETDRDWAQVTYPGASTGWIPKQALLVTSGKEL